MEPYDWLGGASSSQVFANIKLFGFSHAVVHNFTETRESNPSFQQSSAGLRSDRGAFPNQLEGECASCIT